MKEFIFGILSSVFQMDLMDTHSIPFAFPLMLACLFAGTFGFAIVKMVGNEKHDENETGEETANRMAREIRMTHGAN